MYTNGSGVAVNGVEKVSFSHDAMIDLMIANPRVTQRQIAAHFGYTEGWVSTVVNCDAFKGRLEQRKVELVDPVIRASIEERFRAVADLSLQRMLDKLELPAAAIADDFLVSSAKLASAALGYGAKQPGQSGPAVIINMPGVAQDAKSWAAKHARPIPDSMADVIPIKATVVVDHENPTIALPHSPA